MYLVLLWIAFGLIGYFAGSSIYKNKNRNPNSGGIIGALAGGVFGVIGLVVFVVIALSLRTLIPGDRDYYMAGSAYQQPYQPYQQPYQPYQQLPQSDETARRLREAHDLFMQGAINEAEYEQMKQRILSGQ